MALQLAQEVEARRGIARQPELPGRDHAIARPELVAALAADLAVLEDEDAVARRHANRSADPRLDFVQRLVERVPDHALDRPEPDDMVVDAEAQDLAQIIDAGARFPRSRRAMPCSSGAIR